MKNEPFIKTLKFMLHSKKMLLVMVMSYLYVFASAQTAIPVSGGNASGEAGTMSYSVGQAFYLSVAGEGGVVAQGVQQPFEISTLTATNELAGINLKLSAYPNPAADYLILDTREAASGGVKNLEYRLYDMNSRLLSAAKIVSQQTTIPMRHLTPSVYFIKIIRNNLELKSFKIIKN